MLNLYITNFHDYLNYYVTMNKVDFILTFLFIAFIYIFVWLPYLRNLSQKIWRTKGMLNMIPIDIVSKNENLKNIFVSGDLLQAVK